MTDSAPTHRSKRIRFRPAAIATGVAASAAIALATTGSLGAFTASITNSTNNAATGVLTMQEQNSGATVTCNSTDSGTGNTGNSINTNSATCAGINKFGGSSTMVPGTAVSTTVTIKNTGTVPANTFTLAPTVACKQQALAGAAYSGSATDLCSQLNLTLTEAIGNGAAATVIGANNVSLASLGTNTLTLNGPIPAGTTATFVFTVTLSSSAGNTYQGLQAYEPLLWTFTS